MSRDDKWLTDMFAEITRDVGSPAAGRDATVQYAPFWPDAEILQRCEAVLSPDERNTASRFITSSGEAEFVFRRAFRRYCAREGTGWELPLAQFRFSETGNGRPFLAGRPEIWFSFSSCPSGCLAAWSESHAVGIDIENSRQNLEAAELAGRYFSEDESELVAAQGVTAFLRFWSLKEAALKSIGEGMPFGMDAFQFELAPTTRIVRAPFRSGAFRAYEIPIAGSTAALVTRRRRNSAVSSNSVGGHHGERQYAT